MGGPAALARCSSGTAALGAPRRRRAWWPSGRPPELPGHRPGRDGPEMRHVLRVHQVIRPSGGKGNCPSKLLEKVTTMPDDATLEDWDELPALDLTWNSGDYCLYGKGPPAVYI